MRKILALLTVALVVLAACADDVADTTEAPAPTEPTGGLTPLAPDTDTDTPMGPGISVADLLASTADGPFVVNGYLFVATDGTVVLADAIAESYPPQPAEAQVPVEGADLISIPLVEAVDGEIAITQWTESTVQLLGDLVDGVLVVDATTK
jgi:hypothetical protein